MSDIDLHKALQSAVMNQVNHSYLQSTITIKTVTNEAKKVILMY